MGSATLTVAASVPDWITAISTAVLALVVVVTAVKWMRQQAGRLRRGGEAPGGAEGEDTEFFEDVLRDAQGSDPRWFKEQQRDKSWLDRWQRHLRRKRRRQRAQERAQRNHQVDQDFGDADEQ